MENEDEEDGILPAEAEIEKSKLYEFTKYFTRAAFTKLNKLDGKPEISKAFKIGGGLGGAGVAVASGVPLTSLVTSSVEETASACAKIKQKKDKIQLIQIINSTSSKCFEEDFLRFFVSLSISVYKEYKISIEYVNLQSCGDGDSASGKSEGLHTARPAMVNSENKTQAVQTLGEYGGELAFNRMVKLGTQSHDRIISSFMNTSLKKEMEAKWDSITTLKLYYYYWTWAQEKLDGGQVVKKKIFVTPYELFVERILENLTATGGFKNNDSTKSQSFFKLKNIMNSNKKNSNFPIRTTMMNSGENLDSVHASLACGNLNLNFAADAIYDLLLRDPSFSWTLSVSEDIKDASRDLEHLIQELKSLHEKTDDHNEDLAELKKITEEIPTKLLSSMSDFKKSQGHHDKKIQNVWFQVESPILTFTGRKKFLTELHEKIQAKRIQQDGATNVGAHCKSLINVIAATGGIGKTETARMYISKHGLEYDHIVWIDAEDKSIAEASFELLAKKLKIEDSDSCSSKKPGDFELLIEQVYMKLLKNTRLLLVLDNAEALDDDLGNCTHGIRSFLPKSLHPSLNQPSILVTSRNRKWDRDEGDVVDVIELPCWTQDESANFVVDRLKLDKCPENKSAALLMCQFFGGLPIAVHSAVVVIQQQSELQEAIGKEPYKIRDFITDYENLRGKEKVLRSKTNRSPSTSTNKEASLMTLWNVTFDKIRQRENGPAALKVLSTMAYLSPAVIPLNLICALFEKQFDEASLGNALVLLTNYCLITKLRKHFYTMHRMIQAVSIEHSNTQIKSRCWSALSTFAISFFVIPGSIFLDSTFSKENQALIKLLIEIDKFIREVPGRNRDPDIIANMWYVFNNLAQKMSRPAFSLIMKFIAFLTYDRRIPATAEESFSYVLSDLEREMGLHGIQTLDLKSSLAQLYVDNMRFGLGKQMYEEVLRIQTQVLGLDHPETQTTVNSINQAENYQTDHENALDLSNWILKCWEGMGLENSEGEDALKVKSHVGHLLVARGDYAEAIELFKQILKSQMRMMGEEHVSTLRTQCNIMEVLIKNGKSQMAEEVYLAVKGKIERVLGPNHPSTLKARFNHAFNLSVGAHFKEALAEYENIFKIEKRLLGSSHRDSLSTLSRIGEMYMRLGRSKWALVSYLKVLRAKEAELRMAADRQPFTLTNKSNLPSVQLLLNKDDIGLKMLKTLLKKQQVSLESGHQDQATLDTKFRIGQVYFRKGNFEASARIAQSLLNLGQGSCWGVNSNHLRNYTSSCEELLKHSVEMLPKYKCRKIFHNIDQFAITSSSVR